MHVTIVIPCYNQQDKLPRALQSVYQQSVQPREVLVIDDGSKFPVTVQSAPSYVRVIRVTNRGLPNARNVGLMNAKGEAILFLDGDDWLEPDYLEKTIPLLSNGTDVVLTGIREHGPTRKGTYKPGFNMPWQDVTYELCIGTFNRFFYAALHRTDTLREIGGYNGRMTLGFEDWDVWCDLLKRGAKFRAIEEPLFNYDTSNPDSMLASSMRNRDEIVREMFRHHAAEMPCLKTSS